MAGEGDRCGSSRSAVVCARRRPHRVRAMAGRTTLWARHSLLAAAAGETSIVQRMQAQPDGPALGALGKRWRRGRHGGAGGYEGRQDGGETGVRFRYARVAARERLSRRGGSGSAVQQALNTRLVCQRFQTSGRSQRREINGGKS